MRDTRESTSDGRAILRCRSCTSVGHKAFTIVRQDICGGHMPYSTVMVEIDGRRREVRLKGDTERALHRCCPACGSREVTVQIVKGRMREETPCDGRCLSARRASCECSCAGKNHGAGHRAW